MEYIVDFNPYEEKNIDNNYYAGKEKLSKPEIELMHNGQTIVPFQERAHRSLKVG